MNKWYETGCNDKSILSSRIRLARNIKNYRFPAKANDSERLKIIDDVSAALQLLENGGGLRLIRLDALESDEKGALIDRHIISPHMASEKRPSGVFVSESENVSIMSPEEDHLRIQAIEVGDNIENAFDTAMLLDNALDDGLEFAFDESLGYLTSCPTNLGTGLRASFMLHLPYLEANGQITGIVRSLSKFGIILRGTFGEGSNAFGSVYQISNQVTLGLTEEEIVNNIKVLTGQIIEKENALLQKDAASNRLKIEDKIWRTYGILSNARIMTEKEALNSLSVLKSGVMAGILGADFPNIYNLIINIRAGALAKEFNVKNMADINVIRADYLRGKLKKVL